MIYLAQSIITLVGVANKLANKEEVNKKKEEKLIEFRKLSHSEKQQETYNQYLRNCSR